MLSSGNYSSVESRMRDLTDRLAEAGVTVHLLFLGEALQNNQFMPLWDSLAERSGGETTYINDPSSLYKTVENLYFSSFTYTKSLNTELCVTDASQAITVNIPKLGQNRVRLYFSGALPGVKAFGDGVALNLAEGRTYAALDLAPPFPDTVILTIPPGRGADLQIYMMIDELPLIALDSEISMSHETSETDSRQKASVTITLSLPLAGDIEWQVTTFDPDENEVAIGALQMENGKISFEFYPEAFGTYSFFATASLDGFELSAQTTADIIAPPTPPARDYSLWFAIGIGAFLIIAAVLFAIIRRKRAKRFVAQGTVPLAAVESAKPPALGEIRGKLDIYGIIVDEGKTEIPAVSYRFTPSDKGRSLTLELLMDRAGVPYHYPAAAKIYFSPGYNDTLIVKNNSNAAIYCAGQPYYKGEQAVLCYGQKIYIVFEDQVSEFEVYYLKTIENASSGTHVQLELANR